MIGERLRLVRMAAGLSLRGLAAAMGNRVTAQAIGKYERNESMPSPGVLIALASALGVTDSYLRGEREIALERIAFREKVIASKKEEARLDATIRRRLERHLLVDERLNLATAWDRPTGSPYPILTDVAEAERAAHGVRDQWELGRDPIANLVEVVETRGIKVLSVALEGIDGLTATVRREGKPPLVVIVLNQDAWSERKRFTLAHELGHTLLDVADPLDKDRACRRFAGAFLMPAETLWAEVGKRRTSISLGELAHLKRMFGVSLQAITTRCRDLGILGPRGVANLLRVFAQRGWHRPPYAEIGTIDPAFEAPRRIERLCFRALAEGVLSEPKAAEILGMSVRRLKRLMDDPQASESAPAGVVTPVRRAAAGL